MQTALVLHPQIFLMSWLKVVTTTSVLLALPMAMIGGSHHTRIVGASVATTGLAGLLFSHWFLASRAFTTCLPDTSPDRSTPRVALSSQANPTPTGPPPPDQPNPPLTRRAAKAARAAAAAAAAAATAGGGGEPWHRTKATALLRRELFPPADYAGCHDDGPFPPPPPPAAGAHAAALPARRIVCADALAWLEAQAALPGAVFTSIPDLTEIGMIVRAAAAVYIVIYSYIWLCIVMYIYNHITV